MLECLDTETHYRYHEVIVQKILEDEFDIIYNYGPFKQLYDKQYKLTRRKALPKKKVKIFIKYFFRAFFKEEYIENGQKTNN